MNQLEVHRQWLFERPKPGTKVDGNVLLRFRIQPDHETGLYEGECVELGVPSFGETVDAALVSTMEATALYLEALDESGERERVFAEKNIVMFPGEPPEELEVTVMAHPGEVVTPQRLSVLTPA